MLLLFFLLSVSLHQKLTDHPYQIITLCIALALSYVSATSVNDIADYKIDAINHPKSIGRPLITGEGKRKDLVILFVIVSILTLTLAGTVGMKELLILSISILINIVYSLPPIRLSYRTFLAPFVLGVAYVGVPYALGLAISRADLDSTAWLWFAALYLMFVGRIILKDFRDRKGDAKYHKPTFLLRFGKDATCIFSYVGVTIGGLIMIWLTSVVRWLPIIVLLFLVSIIFMIRRLQTAPEGHEEQLSIGVGAKMGNGLLIMLLCVYLLKQTGAGVSEQLGLALLISAAFFANFISFLRNPAAAAIGYKG